MHPSPLFAPTRCAAALTAALVFFAAAHAADGVAPAACKLSPDRQHVTLALIVPEAQEVVSVVVSLGYDPSLVGFSETGGGTALRTRLSARATGALVTPDNTGDALRLVIAKAGGLTVGPIADVEFDRCTGSRAPTVADLHCTVASCAGAGGQIDGCGCAVTVP